jgi:DNA invertase Pin-like site-specific DNA recombinase
MFRSSTLFTRFMVLPCGFFADRSDDKQVRQNKESQLLQYAVAERVRALGWQQVEIINSDLGSSASLGAAQREGFERVLSLVALGEVGIVGSREISRLSRTDKDWCRLLEVCQIFGTLIADEQHVYELNNLDDQLVLGIKGTLSVVELKVLRQRLLAGQEAKARRGELFKRLPISCFILTDGSVKRFSSYSLSFEKRIASCQLAQTRHLATRGEHAGFLKDAAVLQATLAQCGARPSAPMAAAIAATE